MENTLGKGPRIFIKIASAIMFSFGVIILLGWVFYFWLPSEYIPYLIVSPGNLAICFILLSVAHWLTLNENGKFSQSIAQLCSSIVFLICLLTLFQYFFHINLGIDQIIFKENINPALQAIYPGRIKPLTALTLTLLGFTLFFLDNQTISYRSQALILTIIFFISFFEFLIHIYNINSFNTFFGADKFSQMPLSSVIVTLLSGLSILFARPRGIAALILSPHRGGILARRLIPATFVLPILFGYFGI